MKWISIKRTLNQEWTQSHQALLLWQSQRIHQAQAEQTSLPRPTAFPFHSDFHCWPCHDYRRSNTRSVDESSLLPNRLFVGWYVGNWESLCIGPCPRYTQIQGEPPMQSHHYKQVSFADYPSRIRYSDLEQLSDFLWVSRQSFQSASPTVSLDARLRCLWYSP